MKNILFLLLVFSSSLWAQDPCSGEINRLCTEFTERPAQIECLIKNRESVSKECLKEIQRFNQLVKDTGVRSGGANGFKVLMSGLGLIPPKKTIITAEGMSSFEGTPTVIQQGKLGIVSPMWQGSDNSFVTSLTAGTIGFNEEILLPDSDKVRELHRIEIGAQYIKELKGERTLGLRTSFGSAGDAPFDSHRELTFSLNGFYLPKNESENSQWVYTFFLSNNNPLANYIPIPGFIYLYKKNNFTGMFGLPFMSIQWTPASAPWIFSVSYFITNLKTEAQFILGDKDQLSLGFSINQQTFLRREREKYNERLFLNDKRIYLGWKRMLTQTSSFEIQGGSSFDRNLREGRSFNNTEWRRDIGRSLYISSALMFMF